MRLLLDECVDRRLGPAIIGHEVHTVPRMGWAGKRNGELLSLAAAHFDVFVTVDRQLPLQHDVAKYDLAVVVLMATSNRLAALKPLVPKLLAILPQLRPGNTVEIA
jgi:hypothetical protein